MKSLFFSSHSKRRLSRSPTPSGRRPIPDSMPSSATPCVLRSRNQHFHGNADSVAEGAPTPGQSTFHSPVGGRYQHGGESKVAPVGTANKPQHHVTYPAFTPNSPCTSFLLGGHYYPGKDKGRSKRRLDRSRTRRQFWALWGGLCLVISTVLFLLGSILASPFVRYQHGMDPGPALGLRDPSLHVLTLERELEAVQALEGLRREQRSQLARKRRDILERIVPDWLHLYHPSNPQDSDGQKLKRKPLAESPEKKEEQDIASQKRKLESETVPVRPTLTLANMQGHHGNSCAAAAEAPPFKTTLVVQASWDRLWVLQETCHRWHDPIVAVVGSTEATAELNVTHWNAVCPQLTLLIQPIDSDPALYPINRLRNLALDAVSTSHVLVADVDFVPSLHLEATIQRAIQKSNGAAGASPLEAYTALVVPAFDRVLRPPCATAQDCRRYLQHNASFLPETFAELRQCVHREDCQVFQSDNNWEGHYSTRTEEWLEGQWYQDAGDQGSPKQPRSISCFHTLRYEPYVVLRWCGSSLPDEKTRSPIAPYYDERFYGYGKNKIEYIQHLRLLGYRFQVLPEGFLTHNPHVDSKAKKQWAGQNSQLHREMDRLYPKFLRELLLHVATNHSRPIVLPCPKGEEEKEAA